jgi:transcriptional regulator with XRE-family HTH domain
VKHRADVHAGRRLKLRRLQKGMTLEELGQRMDRIHVVQVWKYENGQNRMSVSKLWEACHALDVEPGWFFKGLKAPKADPQADAHLEAVLHAGSILPEVAKIPALSERDRFAVASLINALCR